MTKFAVEIRNWDESAGLDGTFEAKDADAALDQARTRWDVSADSLVFPVQRAYPV